MNDFCEHCPASRGECGVCGSVHTGEARSADHTSPELLAEREQARTNQARLHGLTGLVQQTMRPLGAHWIPNTELRAIRLAIEQPKEENLFAHLGNAIVSNFRCWFTA